MRRTKWKIIICFRWLCVSLLGSIFINGYVYAENLNSQAEVLEIIDTFATK